MPFLKFGKLPTSNVSSSSIVSSSLRINKKNSRGIFVEMQAGHEIQDKNNRKKELDRLIESASS